MLKVFNDNLEKSNNNNQTIQEIKRIITNISNGLNSMENEENNKLLDDGSNDEASTISNQDQSTNY